MRIIRKTLTAAALGLCSILPASAGDFDLSDKLSITGFIDMSYTMTDPEGGTEDEAIGLDQFEIDFMYGFSETFSAQVDLQYTPDDTTIESAWFTMVLTENLTFKAGRFLSYSGWETAEPTGLFQFSGTGYADYFYGGYQQGLSAMYSTDFFDLGVSVVDDLAGVTGDAETLGIELALAIRPTDYWTIKAFYLTDEVEDTAATTEDVRTVAVGGVVTFTETAVAAVPGYDIDIFNIWTSVEVGGFTLAAEYGSSEGITAMDDDNTGFLLMGNYGWDNGFALTLRYHALERENAAGTTLEDTTAFTISPSYAVNDYLLIVTEARFDTDDAADVGAQDTDSFAVEALITF